MSRAHVPGRSTDVAFTPAVKALQAADGSRAAYARLEERGGWETVVTPDLAAFLAATDSAYLGTANAAGQPYIQHRGGPKGFIRVVDESHLAFADFVGNRQFITTGNLRENPKAFLFLMDYAQRRRIKIWGEARSVEPSAELSALIAVDGYRARMQQAIVFRIAAWDTNCPQHIPRKLDADAVEGEMRMLRSRIAELESEVAALRAGALP
jgi:predicted pyridoxine 5'-phosphate oxidase superfamily flavin-nucleotide-binding protein